MIVTNSSCSDTSACYNITTVGVNESVYLSSINIFPNPSTGKFIIEMENGVIEIYSVMGEKIYVPSKSKQQTSNEIDLSDYPKGIYFVRIYDGEKIYTEKIVIK